jgi:uncharacterized protein
VNVHTMRPLVSGHCAVKYYAWTWCDINMASVYQGRLVAVRIRLIQDCRQTWLNDLIETALILS